MLDRSCCLLREARDRHAILAIGQWDGLSCDDENVGGDDRRPRFRRRSDNGGVHAALAFFGRALDGCRDEERCFA